MWGGWRCLCALQSVISDEFRSTAHATRHSQERQIVPQVVEAEVLDAGALLRQTPGGGALLDAFSGEGEAPAGVLSPRHFERRHGVRIQGNAASVARLRRAVIEPRLFPVKVHAAPFEPQNLARATTGRERKL